MFSSKYALTTIILADYHNNTTLESWDIPVYIIGGAHHGGHSRDSAPNIPNSYSGTFQTYTVTRQQEPHYNQGSPLIYYR